VLSACKQTKDTREVHFIPSLFPPSDFLHHINSLFIFRSTAPCPSFPILHKIPDPLKVSHLIYRDKERLRVAGNLSTSPSPHLLFSSLFPPKKQESLLVFLSNCYHNGSKGIREKTPSSPSIWTLTPESRFPSVSSRRRTGATLSKTLLRSE